MRDVIFCIAGASPECPDGRALRHVVNCIAAEVVQHGATCAEIESVAHRFAPGANGTEEYLDAGHRNFDYASTFLDNSAYPRKPYWVLTRRDWELLGGGSTAPPTASITTLGPRLKLTSADSTFSWSAPCGWDKEVHVLAGDDEARTKAASWLNDLVGGAGRPRNGRFQPPEFLPALALRDQFSGILRCVLATLLADCLLARHVVVVYLRDGHAMFGVFRSVFGVLNAITEPEANWGKRQSVFRREDLCAGDFGTQIGIRLRETMHAVLPFPAVRGRRSTYL